MPDHRRRIETDLPTLILNSPADIDVITCRPKSRVKASYFQQLCFAKCHVAAGDVFSVAIVKQDMHGPTRSVRHTFGNRSVTRRSYVWTTHCHVRGSHKGRCQIS